MCARNCRRSVARRTTLARDTCALLLRTRLPLGVQFMRRRVEDEHGTDGRDVSPLSNVYRKWPSGWSRLDALSRCPRRPPLFGRLPLEHVARQTRHVDVATVRDGHHVTGRLESTENLPAFKVDLHQLARECVVGDVLTIVAMGQDPHLVFRCDEEALRASEMFPDLDQFAVRVEDLNAVVLTVADIHTVFGVNADRMRYAELSRLIARRPPGSEVLPRLVEFHNTRIAVAV